jgi:hypothetical protein
MSFIHDSLETAYQAALHYQLYLVRRLDKPPHLVSLAAVYGIKPEDDLPIVRARLNGMRALLINRIFDMARHEKRFPVSTIVADEHYCDQDKLKAAFELCCYCRPPGLIYPPKSQKKKGRSCGYYNHCPACWARVVEHQFRQYERFIAALTRANSLSRIYATTHITEQFVPFVEIDPLHFANIETFNFAVQRISAEIGRYKHHLDRRRRNTHRKTEASLWRIVPVAAENGWRMQLRQLFLTMPGVEPPTSVIRLARTMQNKTVLLTDSVNSDAVISFIDFSSYPEEHLKEDLDLTAASLNAMASQHMLGGGGKFRAAGKELIARARVAAKQRQNDATQKTA